MVAAIKAAQYAKQLTAGLKDGTLLCGSNPVESVSASVIDYRTQMFEQEISVFADDWGHLPSVQRLVETAREYGLTIVSPKADRLAKSWS